MTLITAHAHQNWQDKALLTQSIVLDETPLPRLLGFCVVMMACLMTGFIGWATLAPIDEMTTASGQIVPSGYVQSVQNLDGGVVNAILVEDGQIVHKGQILFRLDATNADADFGQMTARQESLRQQAWRLKSFVTADHDGKTMSHNTRLSAEERAILDSMIVSRSSQKRVLLDQLAQKQKEQAALMSTRVALQKNLDLTEEQNRMYNDIAEQGAGSRIMVISSERDVNQLRGQLDETNSSLRQIDDAMREIHSRIVSLDADLKQDAMKNLGQVEAELREIDKTLAKTKGAAERTNVVAPVDGIVKGLSVHTLGAVIQPGQLLMEIVPVDKDMVVEAAVLPSDIGHVKVGQPVKVKISAFDFSRYGSVPGKVDNISATTFQTDKDESFYKVKVTLDRAYVGNDPRQNRITPGMTLQANIVTGKKTVMQYLLKPIQYALDGAFHEN